jgi:signal transduction histidine kinase
MAEGGPEDLGVHDPDRDALGRLSDAELQERLEALRAEELRRLGRAGSDPKRARFYQQTEKLASLGILTRGLAHEFNNLFSGVIAHCDYSLRSGDAETRVRALEIALSQTRQASILVKNLQRFARQDRGKYGIHDPVELVARTADLLAPSLRTKGIRARRHLEAVKPFFLDPVGLQQLILNLLANAMQASRKGGEIEISLKEEDELCVLTVQDWGRGIPEEDLDQIFTPFFSTKGVYARREAERQMPGTGLGLAVSFGIVRRHGGTIEVASRVGEGTAFTVKLPVRRSTAEVASTSMATARVEVDEGTAQ